MMAAARGDVLATIFMYKEPVLECASDHHRNAQYQLTTTTELSNLSPLYSTMKFTSITTLASLFLVAVSSAVALPVHHEVRDVFVPPILYPRAGTVWKVGEKHRITWTTSNHPAKITNQVGRIMLRKGDFTTPLILANDFDILLGQATITVPWVEDGDDYQVVVFGDSGNFSPAFTITGA
ncbi:hypothetical protein M413DRAFT_447079 [Hebeloma cylindrosporum]|uniref:Yeast cell wall synthesis Kre9/Knh1-like N-terminal domain-containing protein n=1 Tax=Hebeloma cylindrosporum TaxID=76867 RepID=A0A0C2XPT5_HEBCY|nr:hypothetical protein M413DRAFT_447079 [Hebeloma cylindrosporum h7]